MSRYVPRPWCCAANTAHDAEELTRRDRAQLATLTKRVEELRAATAALARKAKDDEAEHDRQLRAAGKRVDELEQAAQKAASDHAAALKALTATAAEQIRRPP